MSDRVINLVNYLKYEEVKFVGINEGRNIIRCVKLDEVFYFEAVGRNVFLYGENEVLEIKEKLYQVEEIVKDLFFARVSKSMIVSVGKITCLMPLGNGKFLAELKNGEKIEVSRSFVRGLKEKLGVDKF